MHSLEAQAIALESLRRTFGVEFKPEDYPMLWSKACTHAEELLYETAETFYEEGD